MTSYDLNDEKYTSLNSDEDIRVNEYTIDESTPLYLEKDTKVVDGTGNVFNISFSLIQTCVGAGNLFFYNRYGCITICF